jgi:hypothetical protein
MNASRTAVLDVRLHDRHVGTITNIVNDTNIFVMDDGYRTEKGSARRGHGCIRTSRTCFRKDSFERIWRFIRA